MILCATLFVMRRSILFFFLTALAAILTYGLLVAISAL